MFAILCLLTVFPFADSTNRASAEVNGDEYTLTIGMNGDINFSINPTTQESQGGSLNVAKTTIISSTNAPTGYQLYISSADDDNSFLLEGEEKNTVRDDSKMQPTTGTFIAPEALFTSQDTPATWGYAIPGVGSFDESYDTSSPSTSAKFAAVPTAGNGQLIHEADAAIDNDSVDIYYGTKANSRLRHGKYKTWVKYSAVTDMSSEVTDGISIFPRRIRNNYEPGTTITITSETRIASDLGILLATVNNQTCGNIKKVTDNPLVLTCEIPEGLENGEYDVALEIPQYGKTFTSSDKLRIVDPYDVMQEIDREIYDSVVTEQQYQFVDSRDDKKYYVTKLKNGDLYMTQNLDFELSMDGTTLSPETSDVNTEKTISVIDSSHYQYVDQTKYSHTENIDESGKMLSNYDNGWNNSNIRGTDKETGDSSAHVITIPGATQLTIDIYHAGESCCDFFAVYQGSHPDYTASTNGYLVRKGVGTSSNYATYDLNGNSLTLNRTSLVVEGDTITIAFSSDISVVGYGYYAVVRGTGEIMEGAENPENFIYMQLDDDSQERHLSRGSVYSLSSAMTNVVSPEMESTESICPKGWHLDNFANYNSSFAGLYGNTSKGNGTITMETSPLYLVDGKYLGGEFSNIKIGAGGTINTNVRSAEYYYNRITTANENPFYYVRCIYRAPQHYSINFNANGGSNPPEEQFFGGWESTNTHTFTINKSVPSREGSTFKGWSENANASDGEYQPGGKFVATGQHTLYAIWSDMHNYFDDAFEAAGKEKTNGYYAMQDMTSEICAAVPKLISEFEANTTQLIDLRDNKIYFVSKLQDGKCWMTQNLNYELPESGVTLDPSSSSVATSRTISSTDFEEDQTYYQNFGDIMTNDFYGSVDINSVASSISDPLVHYLVGSSYTYPAATALVGQSNIIFTSASDPGNGSSTTTEQVIDEPEDPDHYAEVIEGVKVIKKYSHTSNIDDTGKKNSNYGNSWTNSNIRGTERTSASSSAHVLTIPGATSLSVTVYYNGESTSWDWVRIWRGSYPGNTADTSGGDLVVSKLGGGCSGSYTVNGNSLTSMCRQTYTVSGDTVTFAFRSDGSGVGQGYGYYAIVMDSAQVGLEDHVKYEDEGIQNYNPPKEEPTKTKPTAISRTQNIDKSGRKNTNTESGWNNSNIVGDGKENNSYPHGICMSGVDYLTVDLYYGGGYVSLLNGDLHNTSSDYSYYLNNYGLPGARELWSSSGNTYTINGNTVSGVSYKRVLVPNTCVSFLYNGSGSGYYGYYAIVTGEKLSDASHKKINTKYSYTSNLDQTGKKGSDYGDNWGNANILGSTRGDSNNAHVVTISGASTLLVDVFYNTESADNDWVSVWSGSQSSYTARKNYGSSLSGKLGGPQYGNYVINDNTLSNMGHKRYVISGNSVTFSFTSNETMSGDGYGYYAIITGYGTVNNSSTNTKQAVVQESVCPKGWRLPHVVNSSYNEYTKLLPEGNYTDAAKRRYFIDQPLFYTDTEDPVNYINDNSIEPLIQTLKNNYSHNNTALGFVRCVAEETYPFAMVFDANGAEAAVPANVYALFTDNNEKSIMIPNQDISYPGHKFLGWSTDQNAETATYFPGTYYTFDSSSVQLYAIWHRIETFDEAFEMVGKSKEGEYYAMQDMTEEVCNLLPAYDGNLITTVLSDIRDDKLYRVAKLKDEHCWMIQDLAFMTGEGVTLSPSTSDVSSEISTNIAPIVNENGTYYTYEAATAGFGRGLKSLIKGDRLATMEFYNNPAGSKNTICPKGWSLPDYGTLGTLSMTAYSDELELFNSDFASNLNGVWDTSVNEPTLINTVSGYWASTLAQMYYSFSLTINNEIAEVTVSPRNQAMGVRCVVDGSYNPKRTATLVNLGSLQGLTSEIISNTSSSTFASDVIDERDDGKDDRPVYSVIKAGDGRIWMVSSLRYEHEDGAILDPYTSDVPAAISFSPSSANSYYVATPHNKYYSENGTVLDEREQAVATVAEDGYSQAFEFNAATMGYYYTYDYATVNNTDGSSICPAGWQLPTHEMYNSYVGASSSSLVYSNNYDTTGLRMYWTLKMNLGGYYTEPQGDEYTDPAHINEEGFFWSSTRISNRNSRGFWFSPNASNYAYPMARNNAAQVRCVSR